MRFSCWSLLVMVHRALMSWSSQRGGYCSVRMDVLFPALVLTLPPEVLSVEDEFGCCTPLLTLLRRLKRF